MKIAISAVLFSDDSLIGAQRPRALAQLLAERGHEVTVFTPKVADGLGVAPPSGVEVVELPSYASQASTPGASLPVWQRLLVFGAVATTIPRVFVLSRPTLAGLLGIRGEKRAKAFDDINGRRRQSVARVRAMLDAVDWAREANRRLRTSSHNADKFDVVFSTYGPFGSLWFGQELVRINAGATHIVDIRDAMVASSFLAPVRWVLRVAERRALRSADSITVISHGVKDDTLKQRSNRRFAQIMHVLPNGFRKSATASAAEQEPSRGPLRIGYTGQIYAGMRDPRPVFHALAAVRDKLPEAEFEFHYAGRQGHIVREAALEAGLEDVLINHGFLPHSAALEIQKRMDLLLVLTWNSAESQGIISGKFGEYLAQEKPILAVVTGDLPGSELGNLIQAMKVGHAYEEARGQAAHAALVQYLSDAAESTGRGERLTYEPDPSVLETFNYEKITERLERLMQAGSSSQ